MDSSDQFQTARRESIRRRRRHAIPRPFVEGRERERLERLRSSRSESAIFSFSPSFSQFFFLFLGEEMKIVKPRGGRMGISLALRLLWREIGRWFSPRGGIWTVG